MAQQPRRRAPTRRLRSAPRGSRALPNRSTAKAGPRNQAPVAVDQADILRLDQQLCYVVHAAARAYDDVYRRVLADTGLTYPQYLVMLVLWEHSAMPVSKLGEFLRLDSGTLSPLLKRMEAAGFVRRERSPLDARSVTISLTAEGDALKDRVLGVPLAVFRVTTLSLPELIELRTRLQRLTAALDEGGREA
jgi:MarR family transcriptional regulator, organic hydroperoxide resistance regulator